MERSVFCRPELAVQGELTGITGLILVGPTERLPAPGQRMRTEAEVSGCVAFRAHVTCLPRSWCGRGELAPNDRHATAAVRRSLTARSICRAASLAEKWRR